MAESILYGVLSNILSKLALSAWQKAGLIIWGKEELEKLRQTLTTVKTFILDAEEKQESDHAVKNWIIRLEDVVYDADDLLDEFNYEVLRQKVLAKVRTRKKVRKTCAFSDFKMGSRIENIRKRLDAVAADISMFKLSPRVAVDMKVKSTDRQTASMVRSKIIGREKDKRHIIESLLQEQNDHHGDSISIVAIVGFGGLGKTSLAQLVYNDAQVKKDFNPRIWVCVSGEFDVCIIFKKILESLVGSKVDDLDLDVMQTKLEEKIGNNRYLLVLDDVWNEDNLKWDKFSEYLVFGAPESKILVTARSKKVAFTMGVRIPHVLESLDEDESLALFEQVAFAGQRQIDPKLREIGKDVARRCKGVPLTIKCLGGLMRQKLNEKYWSSVQENEIWKLLKNDDGVFPVLRLSFVHLPNHLKQCFAFCSIFPKNFKMSKDMLIHSWRAQGYIQQDENEDIQDIGDEYFNDLLSRSFFQVREKDKRGSIISYKMHELIHDLALSVAKSSFYWLKDEKEQIPNGIRHVSLEKLSEEVLWKLSKTKGIRTMIFATHISVDLSILDKSTLDKTFSSLNRLRMLNLSRMDIVNLPESIGKLKLLRYLDLSSNPKMKALPDAICNLHNLQTLLLNCCESLKELPRNMEDYLISLKHINVDGCVHLLSSISRIPCIEIDCQFIH